MYRKISKSFLDKIIKPIANTEGKLQDKTDYIFGCLIKHGIVTDEDKCSFIEELSGHITQISDGMSNAFDKAIKMALKKLDIMIDEDEAKGQKGE